jgi:hypothetical protein
MMTRPPLIWSSVAATLASSAGLRKPTGVTSVPSSTRDVTAPTAESAVHASRIGIGGIGMP